MSKRSENAKRRNANQDNLLQKEMERFEKEHNKEMTSILLERQMAKQAMSDIRRHRASSLLAVRVVMHDSTILSDRVNGFQILSKKSHSDNTQNQVESALQISEHHEDIALVKPFLPEAVAKAPTAFPLKCSENVALLGLAQKHFRKAQEILPEMIISGGTRRARRLSRKVQQIIARIPKTILLHKEKCSNRLSSEKRQRIAGFILLSKMLLHYKKVMGRNQ